MIINPLTAIDFYKADHRRQYPDGTTEVYSNFTARSSRNPEIKEILFFGLQYFIKDYLLKSWQYRFFQQPKEEVVATYKRRMDYALGKDAISMEHIEALHDLGYLPIRIKALSEGSLVPIGVPFITIVNTDPRFFWLTNYIETIMSCYLWKPITSATTAYQYRKLLHQYALKTGSSTDFVKFQGHDFSFRGMSGPQDAAASGAAHLLSFSGTDTVIAIDFLEDFYDADAEKELVGCSVPATEHSVMCMGGQETELETFRRLITKVYPKGIVSIVSDSWDFWKVITEYLPQLHKIIAQREGKLVIRPDSGDPVKIICGDSYAEPNSPQNLGVVRCLWNIFGGGTKDGYKHLDSHISVIYGDSISLDRATEILEQLRRAGFASDNIVFGIGSYTYQYVTRDTFGFAIKSTSGVVNGERRDIFKCPATDDGTKKSAKGLLRVDKEIGEKKEKTLLEHLSSTLILHQEQTEEMEKWGLLATIFENGKILKRTTLAAIREKINCYLQWGK
jgi:nicotinamide phosphoribosyltransferase